MSQFYDNYDQVRAEDWPYDYFSPAEMRCRKTGKLLVVPEFMQALHILRRDLGFPLKVNSGYRSPEYDAEIGGAGVHPTGMAVDIGIAGDEAFLLIEKAMGLGFRGIGAKQHGPWGSRFVHLDMLADGDHPRPRLWTYK